MKTQQEMFESEVIEKLEEIESQFKGLSCAYIVTAHTLYPGRYPDLNAVHKIGGLKRAKSTIRQRRKKAELDRLITDSYLKSRLWT